MRSRLTCNALTVGSEPCGSLTYRSCETPLTSPQPALGSCLVARALPNPPITVQTDEAESSFARIAVRDDAHKVSSRDAAERFHLSRRTSESVCRLRLRQCRRFL